MTPVVEVDPAEPGVDQLVTATDIEQDVEHQLAVAFYAGPDVLP